jgi:hypothetical protein
MKQRTRTLQYLRQNGVTSRHERYVEPPTVHYYTTGHPVWIVRASAGILDDSQPRARGPIRSSGRRLQSRLALQKRHEYSIGQTNRLTH